ncbi:MAG: ATP-dependent helicase [Ardenticatenales bacterium]|nr:ATP-dependent helicase [Ardenticatenales bacterium]
MSARVQLTEQQQAVVNHNEGPALVFAVAGAGKTTAMVHRIERLVREGHFPADRILATSFGRGNARDLAQSLQPWPHCAGVHTRTLHALGLDIIRHAQRHGHLRQFNLKQESREYTLLREVMRVARSENAPYRRELDNMDQEDFLAYVHSCKGNLIYADLASARLPDAARAIAAQVAPIEGPLSWYTDLYQLLERVRQQRGMITFPDMLMTGWQILVSYEDVRAEIQTRYHCVLVDEFQDINLAQSEMLDMLTMPRRTNGTRHYMAIGDDDQTIYEWRGANPHFILDFPRRYGGQTYLISENFRCPAGPLVLANAVIRHNRQRLEKRLQLTKGFAGTTALHFSPNTQEMAAAIVRQVRVYRQQGHAGKEMAVLVRLNAQTPPIEQALIDAGINYRVPEPFYDRIEVKTLIDYARLAWLEDRLTHGHPLTQAQVNSFRDAWETICNRPKRYISHRLRDQVRRQFMGQPRPLSQLLAQQAERRDNERIAAYLQNLGTDLHWLGQNLGQPAAFVLAKLEKLLAYKQFWRDSSGFTQSGEGRAVAIDTFIEFAGNQQSLLDFMIKLNDLRQRKVGQDGEHNQDPITLTTLHRAKGLEWPIVFLPDCNQGVIPFTNERENNLEEERRLFYVGITRSQRHLHLYAVAGKPASQFLAEAGSQELLRAVEQVQAALTADPAGWSAREALALIRSVPRFQLESYFRRWWRAPAGTRAAIARRVQAFYVEVERLSAAGIRELLPPSRALWEEIAPLSPDAVVGEFAGMSQLIATYSTPPDAAPTPPPPARKPVLIIPGTWVRCDAGWGQIEKIFDAKGNVLTSLSPQVTRARYLVRLRPGPAEEPVEIDLAQKWVYFLNNKPIYTCSKCDTFSTEDPYRITSQHNNAAHGGVGARYRREKQRYRPLKQLDFYADAPADPFS